MGVYGRDAEAMQSITKIFIIFSYSMSHQKFYHFYKIFSIIFSIFFLSNSVYKFSHIIQSLNYPIYRKGSRPVLFIFRAFVTRSLAVKLLPNFGYTIGGRPHTSRFSFGASRFFMSTSSVTTI